MSLQVQVYMYITVYLYPPGFLPVHLTCVYCLYLSAPPIYTYLLSQIDIYPVAMGDIYLTNHRPVYIITRADI